MWTFSNSGGDVIQLDWTDLLTETTIATMTSAASGRRQEADHMPATIVWGKTFSAHPVPLPSGDVDDEVIGTEGGYDFVSWSSVSRMEELAFSHGVSKDLWPTYPDCEIESEIPFTEVTSRCLALRAALAKVPSDIVASDYWLSFVSRLLNEGHAFVIMV